MNQKSTKKFKFKKAVKLPSPHKDDSTIIYHLWVKLADVPSGLPTEVNPREVNVKTKVYRRIVDGINDSTGNFFINNRGILISAKSVKINKVDGIIELDVGDDSEESRATYGVLDGGHTYHAIISNNVIDSDQYVHLEIATNIQNIDDLASARNTSVQVSDKAIAELANKFEFVKQAIHSEPYAKEISYRQNENERIDAIDLVRLMFMFNKDKFKSSNSQPVASYSGKAQVLKDYIENFGKSNNPYIKLAQLLPDFTKLYDLIEKEMHIGYKEYYENGKFGNWKGIDSSSKKVFKTKYYQEEMKYGISQGFIYPILAAFRALIKEKDGKYIWEIDPFTVWDSIKSKLVGNTIEMSRQLGSNPQSTGKSSTLWAQNYDAVDTSKLKLIIEKMKSLE